MYKKRDARAKLFFGLSKPIAFLPYSLPSPSSLLKLPILLFQRISYFKFPGSQEREPLERGWIQESLSGVLRLEETVEIHANFQK